MAAYTYPGVYVEELSSGQHTITGVPTSIAAFIGWAPQGPVTQATLIQSWSEYQATFGGLDSRSKLGYAVNQFFANGGGECYIVRLVWDGSIVPANGNPASAEPALATGIGYSMAQITATVGSVSGSLPIGVGQPVLQSIAVTAGGVPDSAPLPPMPSGATGTLSATPVYSDGGSSPALPPASLHWESSDPTVVSVDPTTGAVLANGAGTATVTVTSGFVSGKIAMAVTSATSVTLTVSAPLSTLAAGQQAQLAAVATYNNTTAPDVTQGVAWSTSAAKTVLTISPSGLVSVDPSVTTASSPSITATFPWVVGGAAPTTSLTPALGITGPVTTSVAVYPANPILAVTQTAPLNLWGPQSNSPQLVELTTGTTWHSSNDQVAAMASGTVTAVAAGTATITGKNGALTASTTVTVTPATTTLKAISVSPAQVTVAAGLTQQLKATGIYSDGTSADLTGSATWSDGGTAAAKIFPSGLLLGETATTTPGTITAAWLGVTSSPSASLTVKPPVLLSIQVASAATPPVTSIPSGQTASFTATGVYSDGTTASISAPTWGATPNGLVTMTPLGTATATATGGGSLSLFAKNPGAWGNDLRVTVTAQPPPNTSRFNILVQQVGANGQLRTLESFVNLSVAPADPSYVVTVIDNDSSYVTFINPGTGAPVVPTAAPSSTSSTPVALSGGADGGVLQPTDGNFELALLSIANPDAGVRLLDRVDIFNLLCIPGETDAPTISTLQEYCHAKRAFFLIDAPQLATTASLISTGPVGSTPGSITGQYASNSAFYFPWVLAPDPLAGNRPTLYPPCGFVAGIYAATDASIGVWKAPAGINASVTGNSGLQYVLTDPENGSLNPQAINCFRQFKTYGDVVWGARTLAGNDQAGSEWKYVPIRRLALYLESSLYEGTQWVVFEPNDETLWGQIRLNVGTFLQGLFLAGAFAGSTAQKAYFVKCDAENNPPASVALGVVKILVGFAPLYPAEFVVIQIQQIVGQG